MLLLERRTFENEKPKTVASPVTLNNVRSNLHVETGFLNFPLYSYSLEIIANTPTYVRATTLNCV